MNRTTYHAGRAVRPRLRRAPVARHAARGTAARRRRDGARRAALVHGHRPGPVGRVPGRSRPGGARPGDGRRDVPAGGRSATWRLDRRARARACSCGGSVSGSSSATAARCPATWPAWPCTGRRAPAWSRSRNAYTLRGTGRLQRLAWTLLGAVLDPEPARPAPWRPAAPPPGEIARADRPVVVDGPGVRGRPGRRRELVMTPLTTVPPGPWRFTPDGAGPVARAFRRQRRRGAAGACAPPDGTVASWTSRRSSSPDPWPPARRPRRWTSSPSTARRQTSRRARSRSRSGAPSG